MLPDWMKAFGYGPPLKLQPAKAGEQTATNAAHHKVVPPNARRDMCNFLDLQDDGRGKLSCESIAWVKNWGNGGIRRTNSP
jgi:hypothetical protein